MKPILKISFGLCLSTSAFLFGSATAFAQVYVTASASPNPTPYGGYTTVTWSATDSVSCSIQFVLGTHPSSGSISVGPIWEYADRGVTCTGDEIDPLSMQFYKGYAPVDIYPQPTADCSVSPSCVNSGDNATFTWSSTGATGCTVTRNGSGISFLTSGSMLAYNITSNTTFTANCSNGPATAICSQNVTVGCPTNGVCASPPNGSSYASAPPGPLCAPGGGTANPTSLSGAGPWSWTCSSTGGLPNTSCLANYSAPVVNGQCSSPPDDGTYSTAPFPSCDAGTPSPSSLSGPGPWTWTCVGSGTGHTDDYCSANYSPSGTAGVCQSPPNGSSYSSAPTPSCTTGTPSTISGSGPWTWTCSSTGGLPNTPCSANYSPSGTAGVCQSPPHNTSYASAPTPACTTGSPSTISGTGPWTWTCSSTGGLSPTTCNAGLLGAATGCAYLADPFGAAISATSTNGVKALVGKYKNTNTTSGTSDAYCYSVPASPTYFVPQKTVLEFQSFWNRLVPASDVRTGLVGWWTLDEASGNALDSSGYSGTGTLSSATRTTGNLSGGVNFSGTNPYISVQPNAGINSLTRFTVSAWIKPNSFGSANFGRIADKNQSSTLAGWMFHLSNSSPYGTNSLRFSRIINKSGGGVATGSWHAADNVIQTSPLAWQHVAVTYDGSVTNNAPKFYVNGNLVATLAEIIPPAGGSTASDSGLSLYIGNKTSLDRAFNGVIDDVRIYNRVLTQPEVTKLYGYSGATVANPLTGVNPIY